MLGTNEKFNSFIKEIVSAKKRRYKEEPNGNLMQ